MPSFSNNHNVILHLVINTKAACRSSEQDRLAIHPKQHVAGITLLSTRPGRGNFLIHFGYYVASSDRQFSKDIFFEATFHPQSFIDLAYFGRIDGGSVYSLSADPGASASRSWSFYAAMGQACPPCRFRGHWRRGGHRQRRKRWCQTELVYFGSFDGRNDRRNAPALPAGSFRFLG